MRIEDFASDFKLSTDLEYFISSSHWFDATTGPIHSHLPTLLSATQSMLSQADRAGRRAVDDSLVVLFPRRTNRHWAICSMPLTSFVGPQAGDQRGAALLMESRLVTLIGTGGAGKTRLSLQIAEALRGEFSNRKRAWFVELAGAG